MNRIIVGIGILAGLGVVGCGRPDPADRYVRPENVTRFDTLFGSHCSGCHGMAGLMGPAPPLNDSIFQAIVSDEQLRKLIQAGRPGTHMPAFGKSNGGTLTDEQVEILVKGIREEWAGQRPAVQTLPDYSLGDDDPAGLNDADVSAGKKLFADACANCHGTHGRGGDDAVPIALTALGRLMSDQLVRRIIITGRPDIGMPDFAEAGENSSLGRPLQPGEIRDLTAFVRSMQEGNAVAEKGEDDES